MGPLFLVFGAHPAKSVRLWIPRWSQPAQQWPWCSQGYWCSLLPCLSSLVGAGWCGRVMCLNPSGYWSGLGPL